MPVYGTGNVSDKFDERGYMAIPPCLYDYSGKLEKPTHITDDSRFRTVKYTENTYVGNYGEMASWQMRGHAKFG
jgi:hypothetical protein